MLSTYGLKSVKLKITRIYRNLSIRNKILVFNIVIIGIPLLLFAYYTNDTSTNVLVDKSKKNFAREISLVDSGLRTVIGSAQNSIMLLSTDKFLQDSIVTFIDISNSTYDIEIARSRIISRMVQSIASSNNNLITAGILLKDNTIVSSGNNQFSHVLKIFTPQVINYVRDIKNSIWLGVFRIENFQKERSDVFILTKAVFNNESSEFMGLLFFYIAEKDLSSFYTQNIVEPYKTIFVLDKEGKVLSSSDKTTVGRIFSSLGYGTKKEYNNRGSVEVDTIGKWVIASIGMSNATEWRITGIVPLSDIIAENRQITKFTVTLGFVCLIMAFIMAYALASLLSKPVSRLVRTMDKVKNGDMKVRANLKTNDEIGRLGNGFNEMMEKMDEMMKEIYNKQKTLRDYEFRLIQSQIKPHFLYNTIEAIISFARLDMKENVIQTARNIAQFYRISLSSGRDIISIEEEVRLTISYLEIQKMRYAKLIDFEVKIDKQIYRYSIPKLTIQPIVENAIYHGIKEAGRKGNICFEGKISGDRVIITVIDNGKGIPAELIPKLLKQSEERSEKSDFGLSSINRRIKLLYGDEWDMKIDSIEGEYTKVIIEIPAIFLGEIKND